MKSYLLKTGKVAIIVITTICLTATVYAQTEANFQQSELQKQQEELQKQKVERQAEFEKQQEELRKQLVERQAEFEKQQEELRKQLVERQAEFEKQQLERIAELLKLQVLRQAEREKQQDEMQKQQAERLAELVKLQVLRQAELGEQQDELQKQQLERIAELVKLQALRQAEIGEQQDELQKQQAERFAKLVTLQALRQAEHEKQQTVLVAERLVERQKQQALLVADIEKQRVLRMAELEKQQVLRMAEMQKIQGGLEPEDAIRWQSAALSQYERAINKEFPAGSSPSLSISNMLGHIRIIEGANDRIVFSIKIIGKGKDKDEAKKQAESVDVNFDQTGNQITAKTVFKDMQCTNCGRNVYYEVTAPKNTKQVLENIYGDIFLNNVVVPLTVNLEFGKLFANELSEANLSIQNGGATITACENLKIKSSFSRYKIGVLDSITGTIEYGGFIIDELGNAIVNSDFSTMDIGKLRKSFEAEKFTYGSLKIGRIDVDFTKIKIDANLAAVKIALTEKHNFKTSLYNNLGSIKTGNTVFYEKSIAEKDAIVGIVGRLKEPSATVEITNSYGSIAFE